MIRCAQRASGCTEYCAEECCTNDLTHKDVKGIFTEAQASKAREEYRSVEADQVALADARLVFIESESHAEHDLSPDSGRRRRLPSWASSEALRSRRGTSQQGRSEKRIPKDMPKQTKAISDLMPKPRARVTSSHHESAVSAAGADSLVPAWDLRWEIVVVEGHAELANHGMRVLGLGPTRVYTDIPLPEKQSAEVQIRVSSLSIGGASSVGIARRRNHFDTKPTDVNVGRGDDSFGLLLYGALHCDIEAAGHRVYPNVHPRVQGQATVAIRWHPTTRHVLFYLNNCNAGPPMTLPPGDFVIVAGVKDGTELTLVSSELLLNCDPE